MSAQPVPGTESPDPLQYIANRADQFAYKQKLHDNVPDAVHAAGDKMPKDATPPSERWRVVPNRKARRKAQRQMIKRAQHGR